jgi:hypothetical protein
LLIAWRNRRDAAVLARFDDRMLADIGLNRSDIHDAYAQPLWQDPTTILARRVWERRFYRDRAKTKFGANLTNSPPLAPDQAFKRPATDRASNLTV